MSPEEIDLRLHDVDVNMKRHRAYATDLLFAVHAALPLDKVMPPDFKGSHCLVLTDRKLVLHVWVDGKVHPVTFDD